jgi:cyanate permease
MDGRRTNAFETYDRLRLAMIIAGVLAVAGWLGLWFRWQERWIAFVVWGVGNGLATALAIALALLRCPRCHRRGFGASTWGNACRHCGLERE